MDDMFIVTVFVVFDQLCQTFLRRPKYQPKMVPAEVMLVAVSLCFALSHLIRKLPYTDRVL